MRVAALAVAIALGLSACGSPSARGPVPAGSASLTAQAHGATPTGRASGTTDLPASPSLRPATLAAQIRRAEAVIADPASTMGAVRGAGQFEQLADRALADSDAGVRRRVTSALSGRAAAVTLADLDAADSLGGLTAPAPKLPPNWRIIAPLAPAELLRLYHTAQRRTGVPWEFLAAINFVETRFGRVVGPSTAGAQGPMQFMAATWGEYGGGGDVHDPHDAIPATARMLAAHGAPGDMAAALRAYNDSPAYVAAVTAYAQAMRRWPRAFLGYWSWRVLYRQRAGTYVLPVGYPKVAASRLP